MIPWLCEDYVESGSSGGGGSSSDTPIATRILALADAVSCKVKEERNGAYTLEMTYPINGNGWTAITTDRLIEARINDAGDTDYFRIFSVEKDSSGITTIRANHISYDLSFMYYDHPAAGLVPAAGGYINASGVWLAITQVCPEARAYTFTSDVTIDRGFFFADGVLGVRQTITGTSQEEDTSILGLFGGELKWYRHTISLLESRGSEKKVSLSYGENVIHITTEVNSESHYGGVLGFITWVNPDDDNAKIHYNESTVYFTNRTTDRLMLVDLTEYLGDTEVRTSSQAQTLVDGYALKYAKKMQKKHNRAYTTETVDAIPTWYDKTGGIALALCDTATLNYEPFGISKKVKVVATEYDTLIERYTKLTFGDQRTNFVDTYVANTQNANIAKITTDMYPQMWKNDIRNATVSIANLGERIRDTTTISLSSGTTLQNLASFSLTKGTWMVSISARFASNATGLRAVNLATSSGGSALSLRWGNNAAATNGAYTYLHMASSIVVSDTQATYFINGYQSSGGSLSTGVAWDCVRIL